MTRKRDIGSYPQIYLDIVSRVAKGETLIQLPMVDRLAAVSTAHDFHRFRLVLARERHPLFEHGLDITCRVTHMGGGKYILEFISRGLAALADSLRAEGKQPGQHGMPKAMARPELEGFDQLMEPTKLDDEGEETLKRLWGVKAPCEHEWDAQETHCIKCGVPKQEGTA